MEHVSCVVENLQSAIKGPETFCDTCKRKGVPKKTANAYCAICKNKYCAKHAEVSVCQLFVTSLHPAPFHFSCLHLNMYRIHVPLDYWSVPRNPVFRYGLTKTRLAKIWGFFLALIRGLPTNSPLSEAILQPIPDKNSVPIQCFGKVWLWINGWLRYEPQKIEFQFEYWITIGKA